MKILVIFAILTFFNVTKSLNIDCIFQGRKPEFIGGLYVCETTNISISSGNTVTAVTGEHFSNKTNANVGGIYIFGNWELNFVPQGVSKFFPKIIAFLIYQSTIEALHGDEFNEFPELKFIQFHQTYLKTISSKLFEKTQKLIVINFAYNKLKQVGYDLFIPLNISQLQCVSFPRNQCIHELSCDEVSDEEAFVEIIKILREKCPYDDENISTTEIVATALEDLTTTSFITETTITEEIKTNSTVTTTTENLITNILITATEEATTRNLTTKTATINSSPDTTTEENLTTEQETTTTSTTEEILTCSERNVKELICEIKEKIKNLQLEMQETKNELLRISKNSCPC